MTKQHIDIKAKDQVTSTSKGIVGSSWNPSFGYTRQQEIEEARKEVLERQRKEAEEQQPMMLRLAALEGEVMRLKAQMLDLKK